MDKNVYPSLECISRQNKAMDCTYASWPQIFAGRYMHVRTFVYTVHGQCIAALIPGNNFLQQARP